MQKFIKQNYYDILDVPVEATIDDIERAYKLTKKALSDSSLAVYSLFDSDETKIMLEKIEEAFGVLSSIEARRKYDGEVLGLSNTNAVEEKEKLPSPDSIVSKDYESLNYTELEVESGKKDVVFNNKKTAEIKKPDFKHDRSSNFVYDKKFEDQIREREIFTGEFLKKVREYRAISIDDIYSVTKINPEYIRAIEDCDYKKLPARVYLVGFLKQYSSLLNLDYKKVVSSYLKQLEEVKNV